MKMDLFPELGEITAPNLNNLLIADDHFITRHGLVLLLKKLSFRCNTLQAETFEDAIQILKQVPIEVIILDVSLPGGGDASMISAIKNINIHTKILMYSGHEDRTLAFQFINAGANGYLTKKGSINDLIEALNVVISGGMYISDQLLSPKLDKQIMHLSPQELQIAALIAKGSGNIEICAELNLKSSTVSTYKQRIFQKLNINNVKDLIHLFDTK